MPAPTLQQIGPVEARSVHPHEDLIGDGLGSGLGLRSRLGSPTLVELLAMRRRWLVGHGAAPLRSHAGETVLLIDERRGAIAQAVEKARRTRDLLSIVALGAVAGGIVALNGPLTSMAALVAAGIAWRRAWQESVESPFLLMLALAAAVTLPWFAFWTGHPFRVRYMVPCTLPIAAALGALDQGQERQAEGAAVEREHPLARAVGRLLLDDDLRRAHFGALLLGRRLEAPTGKNCEVHSSGASSRLAQMAFPVSVSRAYKRLLTLRWRASKPAVTLPATMKPSATRPEAAGKPHLLDVVSRSRLGHSNPSRSATGIISTPGRCKPCIVKKT